MIYKHITKAFLAITILGVSTTTAAVEAKEKNDTNESGYKHIENNTLKTYYSQKPRIFSNKMLPDNQQIKLNEKWQLKIEPKYTNNDLINKPIDIFSVGKTSTGVGNMTEEQIVGGITPAQQRFTHNLHIPVYVKHGEDRRETRTTIPYTANKRIISLKELDFTLRQQLINYFGLYSFNHRQSGKIDWQRSNGDLIQTVQLNSKLSDSNSMINLNSMAIGTVSYTHLRAHET